MNSSAVLLGTLGGALAGLLAAVAWTVGGQSPQLAGPSLSPWQGEYGTRPAGLASTGADESASEGLAALSQRLDTLERSVRRLVELGEQQKNSVGTEPPLAVGSSATESDPVATAAGMRAHLEEQLATERDELAKLREDYQSKPRYLAAAEEQYGTSIRFYEEALAAVQSVRTADDVARFRKDYADALITFSSGR